MHRHIEILFSLHKFCGLGFYTYFRDRCSSYLEPRMEIDNTLDLAEKLGLPGEKTIEILETLVTLNLVGMDDEHCWPCDLEEKYRKEKAASAASSEYGKQGAEKRWRERRAAASVDAPSPWPGGGAIPTADSPPISSSSSSSNTPDIKSSRKRRRKQ